MHFHVKEAKRRAIFALIKLSNIMLISTTYYNIFYFPYLYTFKETEYKIRRASEPTLLYWSEEGNELLV